ncbi:M81 family metallopeptidase [Mesorhizobium sp. BAC0120]|uniref:M81 family metallopeptidase n=1 Tax=Mesorhizobium sp. BAC0120 TaxID=3090670 RepID=UPI00298CAD2A|nr:M81 family metallopeptidase [Mesorhizobium sp. BAC0120]MDW6023562.1 M81 family metallopeptidase [Mesorhizobium sp. BAC0120]
MRVLIAECMQEISSFNPLPSKYEDFAIEHGDELYKQRGLNTAIGGALAVFEARPDVELVPAMAARAGSAGILARAGWLRLRSELLDAARPHVGKVDALFVSLHGAMGAEGEADPEGELLDALRGMFGADLPMVISLDLHGILTDRMLRQIDGLAIYRTYPHVDFADTGRRAAQLLLNIVDRGARPITARVTVPMLARGDECITRTGLYGDVLADARLMERDGRALAAGVMIGNPFTDAPELCTQAIVISENAETAAACASALAASIWAGRHRLVGKLVPVEKAVSLASMIEGPVAFTDAADATSSGASGDSNCLIKALREGGYARRVLAQIVDPDAARAAHAAGVGTTITVPIGGTYDRRRFEPLTVTAMVESLSRGRARLETMGLPLDAGPTAVLSFENFTVVVMSRAVHLFDRAMYYANGLDPHNFDLTIVKSPHTEFHMYDGWVEKNFNVDAPGSTSANLASLGHRLCRRPIYPLEPDTTFEPQPVLYDRGVVPETASPIATPAGKGTP